MDDATLARLEHENMIAAMALRAGRSRARGSSARVASR